MNVWGWPGGASTSLLPILRPTAFPSEERQRGGFHLRPRCRPLTHVDIHRLGRGAFRRQTLPHALLSRRTAVPEDSPAGSVGPRGIHSPVSINDGPAPRATKCWRWQIRTCEVSHTVPLSHHFPDSTEPHIARAHAGGRKGALTSRVAHLPC